MFLASASPWGSGKTSMLNMIENALGDISGGAAVDARRWTVAHFTPWAASDVDSLIIEFYVAIASALPTEATRAKDLLRAAAPAATAVGKALLAAGVNKLLPGGFESAVQAATDAVSDTLGTVDVPDGPFQERFDKISEAIEKAGTRLLVVVDDLDRLHTDELLAVMKAVRLLGRFPNVHYLLSYDKTTVIDLLTSSDLARDNRDRAHRYLEKIVQYPFLLPPIQRVHIETELHDGLLTVAENLGLDADSPATQYAVEQLIDVLPDPNALTLRSIKQLCLQTDVLCSMLGPDEIDLFDAAVLTYIRLTYPDLYERMPTWRSLLLGPGDRTTRTAEDWLGRVRATIPSEASGETVSAVYRMLVALFPRLPHATGAMWPDRAAMCRIGDPDYFDRYFQFAIPEDDLSDAEVRGAFWQLVRDGELGPDSIITQHVPAPTPQRHRLMTKMINNLSVIQGSPSATSASAAHWITRPLSNLHPVDLCYGWGTVIFGILIHAVATAPSDEEAVRILDDYCAEFGLLHTASILVHTHDAVSASNRLSDALRGIRDQVVQACLRDMHTPSEQPDELLAFARVMNDEMWAQLHTALQDSGIPQQDIAARFVSVQRVIDTGTHVLDSFHDDIFSKVLPDDELDLSGFDDPITVDPTDLSVSGRRAFAAYKLRRARPPHVARRNGHNLN